LRPGIVPQQRHVVGHHFTHTFTPKSAKSVTDYFAFYANGTDLGSGVNLSLTNRAVFRALASPGVMTPAALGRLRALWCLVWSNAPAGSYALTAVASGNVAADPLISLSRTSAPVNITVFSLVVPPAQTNIVSIVATDPIAVAGTNMSWVWPGMTNAVPAWTNWPPPHWGYFTNWGPKPAEFTVRRFGDVSSALTVNYNIGASLTFCGEHLTLVAVQQTIL
jgi:hypothetical protein